MNFVMYSKGLLFSTALQKGDFAIFFVTMSSCSPSLDSLHHIQLSKSFFYLFPLGYPNF